jgi:hypothetical protein
MTATELWLFDGMLETGTLTSISIDEMEHTTQIAKQAFLDADFAQSRYD